MRDGSPQPPAEAEMNSKRLACPFSKIYPHKFDARSSCTGRWGFDGFRCLNDHIRKYHSYQFSCELCGQGFPDASLNASSDSFLDKKKDKHRKLEHADRGDNDNAGAGGGITFPFKRQKKAAEPEGSPGHTPLRADTESVDSPGRHNKRTRQRKRGKAALSHPPRMTPAQDKAFNKWKEDSKEDHRKPLAAKYESLCRCLFGEDVELPAHPYYDFLLARHYVVELLRLNNMPTIEELEARMASLRVGDRATPSNPPGRSDPAVKQQPQRLAVPPRPTDQLPTQWDPYALGDSAASAPRDWAIRQGPDSGFMSKDSDRWAEGQRAPTPPKYVADHAEADDDAHPPLHDMHNPYGMMPGDLDLGEGHTLNDATLTGLLFHSSGSMPHSLEVDDGDSMINYDLSEEDE